MSGHTNHREGIRTVTLHCMYVRVCLRVRVCVCISHISCHCQTILTYKYATLAIKCATNLFFFSQNENVYATRVFHICLQCTYIRESTIQNKDIMSRDELCQ